MIAGDATAVRTRGLTKRFGRQTVVSSLDLEVPRGAVFGFLGPNGSGKTTTIRMLLGLAAPTSGSIELLGSGMPGAAAQVLPRVGALVEGPGFYSFLSATANLHRLDAADRLADPRTRRVRVAAALDRVGLTAAAAKRVGAYSLGMKQRLGIANALLAARDLIVLDEPTNGLDPQGTREVRSLIRSLNHDGTTVLVSSHLLAEIEQVCTHAAIMRAGVLVAQGGLDALRGGDAPTAELLTADPVVAVRAFTGLGAVAEIVGEPDATGTSTVRAALPAGRAPEDVVATLVGAGVRIRGFRLERVSLEDRFVALTGEGFDVHG